MTDIKLRSKFPFTVVSSSVNTGYAAELTASVGQNIDIVNYHKDEYAEIEGSPAQGPFTKEHVGGNQHRHIKLNDGSDSADNRPEAFIISASANSIKIYGPDVKGPDKPRAQRTRGLLAKSPVNINNIETTGNVAGNFNHNYEVFQTVGRRTTNNLINDNFIASGPLTSIFVTSSQPYSLSEIDQNSKSIFVERFNAPGGKEESSRGVLDREGEEYSPNNSLVTRNIKARQPFYRQLTRHNKKFNFDKENDSVLLSSIELESCFFSGSFSVAAKEASPRGFYFKEDGLSVYIAGQSSNVVHRYDLSIPFEIASATFINSSVVSLSARGIAFKNDGTRMFLVASTNVYRYDLSIAWDITTAILVGNYNLAVAPTAISFNSSGNKMFISTTSGGSFIKSYDLSAAWDISSPVLSETLDVSQQQSVITGFYFSNDGLEMIICGDTPDVLVKFSLISDRLLSTAKPVSNIFLKEDVGIHDIYVTEEKNKLFTIGSQNDRIYQYDLDNYAFAEHKINKNSIDKIEEHNGNYVSSSRNDNFWIQHAIPATDLRYKWIADSVSSSQQPLEYQSYGGEYNRGAAFTDLQFEQAGPFGDHLGISGAVDKEEMFTSTHTNTMYRERKYFNFTSSNDFYIDASSISGDISSRDFTISLWVNMPQDMSISFDLTNSELIQSITISSDDTEPLGLFFKPDGTKMYFVGNTNDEIYQYSLTIPWDISTTGSVSSQSISSQTTRPTDVYIREDGKKMYILGDQPTIGIHEYLLGTSWNITTAMSPITHTFTDDASPRGIYFKPDGTKLFVVGIAGDKVYQKTLSTPWDLTTTGSTSFLSIPSSNLQAISFSEDGKHMYLADTGTDNILYYFLNNPWDVTSAVIVSDNFLNVTSLDTEIRGLFVSEKNKKLYFIGDSSDSIYEYNIEPSKICLINYSGSSSDNKLILQPDFNYSNIFITGSEVENDIFVKLLINDSLWHNIVLVSDVNTAIKTITSFNGDTIQIPQSTTKTNIYLDGGLITEATQKSKKLDISKLLISAGKYLQIDNSLLDEISVWDSVLSEQQVNEIFKISKSAYGKQPKKYKEHLFDSEILPQSDEKTTRPLHVYSSRIDDVTDKLFDEMSKQDIELVNYTASVNLKPDTNQIISYSTYFNGPYGSSNWKYIRNNKHPVTRNLTTENTNIISVLVPETNRKITRKFRGIDLTFTLPPSKKQGALLNVKESPVSINKPLKHRFIFKGDTDSLNKGYEITHTYQNNIKYFSNKDLNSALGLQDKTDEQMYDILHNYYANDYTDEKDSPIEKFLGYTYNETIFPKSQDVFLKETRMRTDYITDRPGYSVDGYDRQLGTQRVFWRDNKEDRQRTEFNYINSMGNQILAPSDGSDGIIAIENIITSSLTSSDHSPNLTSKLSASIFNLNNSGELNTNSWYIYEGFARGKYSIFQIPSEYIPEIFYNNNYGNTLRQTNFSPFSDYVTGNINYNNIFDIKVHPSYTYKHPLYITYASPTSDQVFKSSSLDYGLNRYTEQISGKNPFYDSYEQYSADFKNLGKTHSILSEFKISDFINEIITDFGGDIRKVKFVDFQKNIDVKLKDKIERDNNNFTKQNKISFKLNGIKKLLPYNGFYPQDRSLQFVNYLKESYIDTVAVKGGLYISGVLPSSGIELYYDNIEKTSSYTLERYLKELTFLEPLYSPGIFYNMIKSGLAVDWAVSTGSLDTNVDTVAGIFLDNMSNPPNHRLPFQTILNISDGLPQTQDENSRILRRSELVMKVMAQDYEKTTAIFRGFSELGTGINQNYNLSINNFLAETVNFFLKDSKLNSYISKPENKFSQMNENKTYYMDIVLRKTENFTMMSAYSSSINVNNGKMSGRYFGPSYYTGTTADELDIINNYDFYKTMLDPSYCIYTPPYFYGDSVARISFKPYDGTRQYSLSEIISNSTIQYFNLGLLNNPSFISGNLYNNIAMAVSASINLFGITPEVQQTVDQNTGESISATNNTNINKWVISTKMEVPVLNFINQEYVSNNNLKPITDMEKAVIDIYPNYQPLTSSGFGIGMWSGYGEIPINNEGIFFDLRESYPNRLSLFNEASNTGSLIESCGFESDSKRIGEIADKKIISEAIVIIPYSTNQRNGSIINADSIDIRINDTTKVENFNLFKIHRRIFDKQKINLEEKKAAIQQGNFGAQTDIEETSISRMIEAMQQYVMPPNLNFLEFDDIHPFVMYFAEFKTTLDKQDLADIWQGVMPKPAMKAELEDVTISQNNTLYDFFHGEGLPQDVKFMIFKVKKKAEINYYKMTADSTDDNLFPEIQVGKDPSPYSYNWPYDYFSLVELAKVDIEIDYESKDNEQVTIPSGNTIGQVFKNATVARTTAKNSAVRGIIKK